jgi:hypothetical protein
MIDGAMLVMLGQIGNAGIGFTHIGHDMSAGENVSLDERKQDGGGSIIERNEDKLDLITALDHAKDPLLILSFHEHRFVNLDCFAVTADLLLMIDDEFGGDIVQKHRQTTRRTVDRIRQQTIFAINLIASSNDEHS